MIRNVGKFDNADSAHCSPFEKLALIYAENGRGKTTISAILRSLNSGNPQYIIERKRLGASHEPHIVVQIPEPQPAIYENGQWSQTVPNMALYDDAFVAENVCSGVEVFSTHRQNLHELIIGAEGISLSNKLRDEVSKIEDHNRKLRELGNDIPSNKRGPFTIDQFCNLKKIVNIEEQIKAAKKRLAAAHSSGAVKNTPVFAAIKLPDIGLSEIEKLLEITLKDVDATALERVQIHLNSLNKGGEVWVREGLSHLNHTDNPRSDCPFCGQYLVASQLVDQYRQYFSKAYSELTEKINDAIMQIETLHGKDAPAAFERRVREAMERKSFWQKFAEIRDISFDTATIALVWKKIREAITSLLKQKLGSPLKPLSIDKNTKQFLAEYDIIRKQVSANSDEFLSLNNSLAGIKEQSGTADISALQTDLENKLAIQSRFEPSIVEKCNVYTAEKASKKTTEKQKKTIRDELDKHREQAFPAYGNAINDFLLRFNATFRIGPVDVVNNRAGSSANYTLLINSEIVTLSDSEGGPCFRNTLSAGDRNTLALAFFFASFNNHPNRRDLIVVLDDPMTSLDENRQLMTLQEIDRLTKTVAQVIVLSHSKVFLLGVWEQCQQSVKSALRISRSSQSSGFTDWDVNADMITEHDRRYERCLDYIENSNAVVERQVAESLRPMLERFIRVSYSNEFSPGAALGQFIKKARTRLSNGTLILNQTNINELRMILDYANKFHHDTNASYATEIINDAELVNFSRRTIGFMRTR